MLGSSIDSGRSMLLFDGDHHIIKIVLKWYLVYSTFPYSLVMGIYTIFKVHYVYPWAKLQF